MSRILRISPTATFLATMLALLVFPVESNAQQFLPGAVYSVGLEPGSTIAADLNNDGKLDLATCLLSGMTVLLGNGDGTFQPARHFQELCTALAAADFNGDGIMDLAVVQYVGKLVILLGNGDGTYTESSLYSGAFGAVSLTVADFNGDGHADIAVAVSDDERPPAGYVAVFLGNGDGTLKPFEILDTPRGHPWSVAAGDVNGDGHVDLVVSDDNNTESSQLTLFVFLNNGDGTFTRTSAYHAGYEALDVVIADLNHDNKPDLVVASAFNQVVGVFLGNGNGTFSGPTTYSVASTGVAPQAVVVADFNLDGNPDIVYVPFDGNPGLMYGNGDGTFQSPIAVSTDGYGGTSVAVADFNRDGAPDLALPLEFGRSVAVFLNAE